MNISPSRATPPRRNLQEEIGMLGVEGGHLQDRDSFNCPKDQEIVIAGHDANGMRRHGATEEHIIHWVATELQFPLRLNQLDTLLQEGQLVG